MTSLISRCESYYISCVIKLDGSRLKARASNRLCVANSRTTILFQYQPEDLSLPVLVNGEAVHEQDCNDKLPWNMLTIN